MSVLFYDRIFPFVFPPRGNKSRLLKTNILTIRKNRDASNNETRQFEAKLSKNRSRRRYCEWSSFSQCISKGSWYISKINLAKLSKKLFPKSISYLSCSHDVFAKNLLVFDFLQSNQTNRRNDYGQVMKTSSHEGVDEKMVARARHRLAVSGRRCKNN